MALSYKQDVYDHIRQRMLDGSLKAGDHLSYGTLAKEVGVSATPVREAISRLESEGLVDQLPRVGAFVKRMDHTEIKELYELREALEGYAAALAVERITDDQMQELEGIYSQMQQLIQPRRKNKRMWDVSGAAEQIPVLDISFHLLIVKVAGNRRIAKTISDYRLMSRLFGDGDETQTKMEWILLTTVRDHGRVLRALRARDAEAARFWMQRHIISAKKSALAKSEESRRNSDIRGAVGWSESVRHTLAQMERYSNNPRTGRE